MSDPVFPSIVRDGNGWLTLERDVRHRDPWTELVLEKVRTPSRHEPVSWTVVHRKAATVIAPRTASGGFLLIRQERVPVRAELWEFPAGQIDETTDHSPERIASTALRELAEESGHELAPGAELIPLGLFFTSPGFTDEHGYLLLATKVQPLPEGRRPDHGECITGVREFSPDELRDMIARGEIRDANTLATFARLVAAGFLFAEK